MMAHPYLSFQMLPLAKVARNLNCDRETVRRWAKRYDIGTLDDDGYGGLKSWRVSWPACRMIADHNWQALRAFKDGDRTSALVSEYIIHVKP